MNINVEVLKSLEIQCFFAHVKKRDHRGRSVIILEQHQV